MGKRRYVLGKGKMPLWCRKVVDTYKKLDGSVGYELRTHKWTYELFEGDKVIKKNGLFTVERKNGDVDAG